MRLFVWDVDLGVTRPERPNLQTQAQFRVQAPDHDGAVARARANAARDGLNVIGLLGVVRRWMVREKGVLIG